MVIIMSNTSKIKLSNKNIVSTNPITGLFFVFFLTQQSPGLAQDAMIIDDAGEVGIGVANPERLLHLRGANAQFRLDRSMDASSFQLVRITPSNQVMKSFVFGVSASAVGNGEFSIKDNETATSGGAGEIRMTIKDNGDTYFQKDVYAQGVKLTSSSRFKDNIERVNDASRMLEKLRGVRFNFKDTNRASMGLIAEEVYEVIPDLVSLDPLDGRPYAVDYSGFTAVLLEAIKEQMILISSQANELAFYRADLLRQNKELTMLKERLNKFDNAIYARFIENFISEQSQPPLKAYLLGETRNSHY